MPGHWPVVAAVAERVAASPVCDALRDGSGTTPEFEPLGVSLFLQDLHDSKYPGSAIYERPIPIHPVVPG